MTRPAHIAVIVGCLLAMTTGPATAHVSVTPGEALAGSYAVLTFSVGHGCDGSATTKVAIKLPEEILSATPTRNPFWKAKKVMVTLPEPVTDSHGTVATERVGQVVYTARTPLPDGERDTFALSMKMPDEPAGSTLAFPVIQTCVEGQNAWIETIAPGGTEELEAPAPTVTLLAGESDDQGSARTAATSVEDDDSRILAALGLGLGLAGFAAGATALVRRRT